MIYEPIELPYSIEDIEKFSSWPSLRGRTPVTAVGIPGLPMKAEFRDPATAKFFLQTLKLFAIARKRNLSGGRSGRPKQPKKDLRNSLLGGSDK
jgi:hypothetical protein